MMKTAVIAMTVIGCDCDAKMCEFIRATPAEWTTAGECEDALKARVVKDRDAGYPLILAICRSTVESPVELSELSIEAPVAAAGTRSPGEGQDHEARSILVRASDGYVVARNSVGKTLGAVRNAGSWLVANAGSMF